MAVLNPRIPGCDYPDKDLCAAAVAFKLALALLEHHGAGPNVALNMLDLVALATVADVAPLRGENRILVRYGLRMMAETKNTGLRALISASGLEGRELTAGRIGFILAPRLNAVGRIDDAKRGLDLLLTTRRERGERDRARPGGGEPHTPGDRSRDAGRRAQAGGDAGPRFRGRDSCLLPKVGTRA